MPARQVQTDLTIAMQTRGFDKGMREILGVSQKSLEALRKQSQEYGKVQESIDKMRDRVQDLAKEQLNASKSMEQITDKTGAAYKFQEERMQKSQESAKKLTQQIKLLQQAHQRDADAMTKLNRAQREQVQLQKQAQQQARWAMTQGMMQGMGFGGLASMFMQRGPGFWRQFAGQRVGGMFRRMGGIGRGMMQAPFGGIQGLQQAVAAIPGGGVVAGQLGAVAAHAQRALQWQQTRLQTAPLIETRTPERMQVRLADIDQQLTTLRQQREGLAAPRALAEEMPTTRAGLPRAQRGLFGFLMGAPKRYRPTATFQTRGEQEADVRGQARSMIKAEESRIAAREKRLQEDRRQLRAETPVGRIQAAGRELLGLGRAETTQRMAQLFQTAGGRFTGQAAQMQQVRAAFAAQTMFGVAPQVAGAFGLAQRRGGLIGGRGGPGEGLRSALEDAISLGLEGAEITNYMQMVAQGIQSFQQTGIPMNKDSIRSMSEAFSGAGVGGVRASTMARGFQNYVQTMGERGITGGGDIMLLQALGGWKGGGGRDYVKALMRLESMKIEGPGGIQAGGAMGELIQRLVREGGGGLTGVKFMSQFFRQRGMKGTIAEYAALAERATGVKYLSEEERREFAIGLPEEEARLKRAPSRAAAISTTQKLEALAKERIEREAPGLKAQADITNKQLAVGTRALKAVQGLEMSSLRLNDSFMLLAGPTLNKVNAGLNDFTKELHKHIEKGGGLVGFVGKILFG